MLRQGTLVVYARDTFGGAEVVVAPDSIAGFEVIRGSVADDRIAAIHVLTPGDTFHFASASETPDRGQRDLIADFATGQDLIDLHRMAKTQTFIAAPPQGAMFWFMRNRLSGS